MRMLRWSACFLSLAALSLPCWTQNGGAPAGSASAGTAKTAAGLAGPKDARAQKSYQEALDLETHHRYVFALDSFKDADKRDGNTCAACDEKIVALAMMVGDYKQADASARELIALAATPEQQVKAHVLRAKMLVAEAKAKKKPEHFGEGQQECESALAVKPGDASALYIKGVCLANQQQDEQAKSIFTALVAALPPNSVDHERIARYAEHPDLVRARMAPAFSVRTIDGKRVSLDELHDKVVLIDFWATWCGPCREALPHIQRIAKEFAGQPLVVLSISLDADANDQKWKDFVEKNEMTWLQYRDGGFNGPIAQMFEVRAIPQTFTIDSDGVLQDQHVGDGNIENKLKKLLAAASARQQARPVSEASVTGAQSR